MRFESPGGGSPLLAFSDNANRANGDIGINWLTSMRWNGAALNATSFPQCTINANQFQFSAAGTNLSVGSQFLQAHWYPRVLLNGQSSGPIGIWGRNMFSEMRFRAVSNDGAVRVGPIVLARNDMGGSVNESQSYMWAVRYSGGAFAALDLLKLIGGASEAGNTFSVLATDSVAPANLDVLRLSVTGVGTSSFTLTCTKNGVTRLTFSDNSPLPAQGYPGMGLITVLNTNPAPTYNFDNFNCGAN